MGALIGALVAAMASAPRVTLLEPSDGRWTARDQPIVLRVADRPPPSEGRLAIFIGRNDVTDLCAERSPGELRCSTEMLPMPSGEQEIAVFLVRGPTDWQEVARLPIQVLTAAGLESAEYAPRLDLRAVAKLGSGGSGSTSFQPGGDSFAAAGQGGFATRFRRSGWEVRAAVNVVAESEESRALRFASLGEDAPQVDLTDYLIEVEHGNSQLAIGHVSFGGASLLSSAISHRGLRFRQKIGARVDFGLTVQSGRIVTGYDDLLGVSSQSYVAAGTFGFELVGKHPGGLRLDLNFLKAETSSSLDFNTGEVPDAEKDTAYGVRLSGETPGGRLRGSAEFAQSRYTNPDDPLLSQGRPIVAVREETSGARALDLAIDVVQNHKVGEDATGTVTLGFQHQRVDPLYRTVGGFVMGDQEVDTGSLSASIGPLSFVALHSEAEDNLDEVPTLLKTRTRSTLASVYLPLRWLFRSVDGCTRAWLPDAISESWSQIHQEGTNRPPSFDPITHIPDQVSENVTFGLSWSFAHATVGYQFVRGNLDNRQPDRARADFEDATHAINLGIELDAKFRLGLGATTTAADDLEHAVTRHLNSYSLDLSWRIGRGVGFRGNYSLTAADDTQQLSENRSWTTLTELNYRFALPMSHTRRARAQVFVRHLSNGIDLTDRVFDLSSQARTWSINGGFSVGLF